MQKIIKESKKYFKKKQTPFTFLAVCFVLLDIISRLPYVNLLFDFWVLAMCLWIVASIVLKFSSKISFIAGLLFLCLGIISSMIHKDMLAQHFGVMVYFFLVIGFIEETIISFKHIKNI